MSEQAVELKDDGTGLKRVLTLRDLSIYGIAFMTPIAPAYIYGAAQEITGGTLAMSYAVAMVAMLFTAASYGKMAGAFPVAGSTYSYTQRGLNTKLGFFAGWGIYLDYVLVPLIVFITGALYANAAVPEIPYFIWVLIIGVTVTVINCLGVQIASRANLILVAVMAAIVVMFVVFCLKYVLTGGAGSEPVSIKPFYNPADSNFSVIISGAALACFSFLGFDSITTMSEEAIKPKKDIGRAAIIACLAGGIIFIIQAYVAQLAWPDVTGFETQDTALFEIAQRVGGTWLSNFYTFAVVLSTLTAGIAGQSSAARLMYGMGRDEVLPKKFFTYLHPRFKTPIWNILIMAAVGIIGSILLDLTLVCELMNFGGLLGFMFVNLSVISHFFVRRNGRNPWKYLIMPALGFLICGYLWINLSSIAYIVGFSWLVIGFVYLAISTKGFRLEPKIYEG
ncbi:MAG: APC family permease [Clostridiales Family XIII bacterium]|nr:APC family permease [Clostridiales Family XIII bacterium]